MQHLDRSPKTEPSLIHSPAVRARVRFLAYHRIKPHVPPLVRAPVNSFEFQPCGRTPRWMTYRFRLATDCISPTVSHHRLQRGLPGYLILFDPHTFVPQRQLRFCMLPSQSVFCVISMHFTATLHIPHTASSFQLCSIYGTFNVKH